MRRAVAPPQPRPAARAENGPAVRAEDGNAPQPGTLSLSLSIFSPIQAGSKDMYSLIEKSLRLESCGFIYFLLKNKLMWHCINMHPLQSEIFFFFGCKYQLNSEALLSLLEILNHIHFIQRDSLALRMRISLQKTWISWLRMRTIQNLIEGVASTGWELPRRSRWLSSVSSLPFFLDFKMLIRVGLLNVIPVHRWFHNVD